MTPAQADELVRTFACDGAASVVESMLRSATANDGRADDRVEFVMPSLEEMAEHRVDAACCLMLSLWPVASELMMHDVCDGIDLCLDHNSSATVIEHLKHVLESEIDPDVKRHFEGLLLHIEQKAE